MTLLACLLAALLQAPPDAAAVAAQAIPETVAREVVPQYQRLSPTLAIAGQPSPDGLARLGEMGFETIVNLRAPGEAGVAAEEGAVRAAGLRYVSVPVTPELLSWELADEVRKLLEDPTAGRILLHCSSSNRVGGVLAMLERERGADVATALEKGRQFGLQPGKMTDAVIRLIEGR